jgi:hypothetical protein
LPEFVGRLIASRLHRQLTGNPLVSVFLRVSDVRSRVENGDVVLVIVFADDDLVSDSSMPVLEAAVQEVAVDVFKKYDPDGSYFRGVRLEDGKSRVLSQKTRSELFSNLIVNDKK